MYCRITQVDKTLPPSYATSQINRVEAWKAQHEAAKASTISNIHQKKVKARGRIISVRLWLILLSIWGYRD
ncbi:hypothetical protein NST83_25090 [Paenibacillus sp. FSL R10-2782]|uniref:hypothetical protein n=1 Tax=Paenibacillus sp. FSL R10-2782 TaxID=2954661 RepID=UPI0031598EA0